VRVTATKPRPAVPATLWHYTCRDHGEPGISRDQKLLPHNQLLLGRHLVWLTDMDTPHAWALGLTNYLLCCDRTQVRVTVNLSDGHTHGIYPWWYYRRTVHPVIREALEQTGMPMHWWVTEQPVPVTTITPAVHVWAALRKDTTRA
jgi:hypothetical protein